MRPVSVGKLFLVFRSQVLKGTLAYGGPGSW